MGAQRIGDRLGQNWAYVSGLAATGAQGPSISAVTYTGTGQTLKVKFTQKFGTTIRTPAGGTGDSAVIGFDVSEDGFSTLKTITTAAITGANEVTLTLSAPPTTAANVQVRYLYGQPIAAGGYTQLDHTIYDDVSIESGRGLPAWFTASPVNAAASSGSSTLMPVALIPGIALGFD